jgi:hypothetical protein
MKSCATGGAGDPATCRAPRVDPPRDLQQRGRQRVTLERPALQRLIADCRAGKIGMVITRDADRLLRDKHQLIALLNIFAKAGVHIEFSEGPSCDRGLGPFSTVRGIGSHRI